MEYRFFRKEQEYIYPKPRADTETSSKKDVFQKRHKTRLVSTKSKRVSHMPRSISAMWKTRSAKKFPSIGVNKSKKRAAVSFLETKHASCLALSRKCDADREYWPGVFLEMNKKLFLSGKIDDGHVDEGKWLDLDRTMKTLNRIYA